MDSLEYEDAIKHGLKKDLLRSIYEDSYYEFFKQAFSVLNQGEEYKDNWHIEYICNRLQKEYERVNDRRTRKKDIIINIPFRAAKSLIVTIVWPVWCWINNPRMKFIATSFSGALALEHAQKSRALINSIWFQDLFADKIEFEDDQAALGMYAIKGGGFRKSVGVGGQITGSGSDFLIIDDPQDPKKAASEVERQNTIDFYNFTLYSRLNNPSVGVRIIVMQRLSEEDLSGHLLSTSPEKHEHICIPAEIPEKNNNISPPELIDFYQNGLFMPTRFTREVLADYKVRLGSAGASGQLQQNPQPEGGNIVQGKWFDIIDPSTLNRDFNEHPIKFYLDTAETEKQDGDFSAICSAFKKDNFVYIANVVKVKKEFHELCKFIPIFTSENQYSQNSSIKVEPKSSGKSVVSQLRNTTQLNIVEMEPPKDDKTARLKSITPMLEARRVKLLKGSWNDSLIQSLEVFPNGQHDDDVDVFVYAVMDLLNTNDFDWAAV